VKKEWKVYLYGKDYVDSTVPLTGSGGHSHEAPANIELGDSIGVTSTVLESSAASSVLRSPQPRGGQAQRVGYEDYGASTVVVETEFEQAVLPRDSGLDDLRLRPTMDAMLETDEQDV
jgi:hypothetical protein